MHKKTLLLLLTSAILFEFTGCVAMDPQTRRARAYRHYVAKQMKKRQKEMARAQKAANREMKLKMKNVQPSEPYVTTNVQEVGDYPSVFAPVADSPTPSQPAMQRAPAFRETTVDPITVSATNDIQATHPDQPSPP